MENSYKRLIENNKTWVAEQLELDPAFFEKLSNGQPLSTCGLVVLTAGCLQSPLLEQTQVKCLCIVILPIW